MKSTIILTFALICLSGKAFSQSTEETSEPIESVETDVTAKPLESNESMETDVTAKTAEPDEPAEPAESVETEVTAKPEGRAFNGEGDSNPEGRAFPAARRKFRFSNVLGSFRPKKEGSRDSAKDRDSVRDPVRDSANDRDSVRDSAKDSRSKTRGQKGKEGNGMLDGAIERLKGIAGGLWDFIKRRLIQLIKMIIQAIKDNATRS